MQPSWFLNGTRASRYESSLQQQGSNGRRPLSGGGTSKRDRKHKTACEGDGQCSDSSSGLVTVCECLSTELACLSLCLRSESLTSSLT